MGRESRNFYRRLLILGISIPSIQFVWNRRDWFQSLEYTPEEEAEETANTVASQNLRFFSPFSPSSSLSSSAKSFFNIDLEKVVSDFSSKTATKEHFAEKLRANKIAKLEDAELDVLVIGGGATGLFAALDAATRGLKVALVEQSDFGSGVTGGSTTLLHSGFKRAQAALRQRDHRQLSQCLQDASELRALERCVSTINADGSSSSSSSPSSASSSWTPDQVVKRMPAIFPISSITECFEFVICSVIFCTCTVLGGGLLPVARPTLPSKITKNFEGIQESETDELVCGYQIPERKIDGYALSRSLAHTATKHGACVVNYARLIGLDCERQQPRNEKKDKFHGITSWELQRRSMDVDGQPFPWFDTGRETDFFMSEPVAKPKDTDDEESDSFVQGAKERFLPERLQEKEKAHQAMGITREEDLPYFTVHAAVIRDELSGKMIRVYPKYVLNCTGRWGDSIRRMFPIKQPQMFERFTSQFFLAAHHNDSRVDQLKESSSSNKKSNSRDAMISARNHIDAKPLFVYPYHMNQDNEKDGSEGNNTHEWSIIGPVDAPIDSNDPYYASPEKDFVITGDPTTTSPSAWRELKFPRITPKDLSFIATASDIFGVHIDSGFTLMQPRVLCESWPGNHPSLCRALRFGGAVDYRTMHQKIVHSVGTETVWSRKKAELMVDSYFIEQSRGAEKKVRIPPCRTKKLALAEPTNCVVANLPASSTSSTSSSQQQQNQQLLLPLTKISESSLRKWARFDGCATVLDAMLRRKQDLFACPNFFSSSKMRKEEIEKIANILGEEWNWSRARLKSEVDCAVEYFDKNSFCAVE